MLPRGAVLLGAERQVDGILRSRIDVSWRPLIRQNFWRSSRC